MHEEGTVPEEPWSEPDSKLPPPSLSTARTETRTHTPSTRASRAAAPRLASPPPGRIRLACSDGGKRSCRRSSSSRCSLSSAFGFAFVVQKMASPLLPCLSLRMVCSRSRARCRFGELRTAHRARPSAPSGPVRLVERVGETRKGRRGHQPCAPKRLTGKGGTESRGAVVFVTHAAARIRGCRLPVACVLGWLLRSAAADEGAPLVCCWTV